MNHVQQEGILGMSNLTISGSLLSCNVCHDLQAEPAHKEAVRGIAFSPSDLKFATCSDDSTIKAGFPLQGIQALILILFLSCFLSTCTAWHDCQTILLICARTLLCLIGIITQAVYQSPAWGRSGLAVLI